MINLCSAKNVLVNCIHFASFYHHVGIVCIRHYNIELNTKCHAYINFFICKTKCSSSLCFQKPANKRIIICTVSGTLHKTLQESTKSVNNVVYNIVHLESLHITSLYPYFVMLLPYSKIESTILSSCSHNTP